MEPFPSEVGFADSKFLLFHREGVGAVIEVRAWNGRVLRVRFDDVVFVIDRVSDEFSDLVQSRDPNSETLRAALACVYEAPPASHPYKVYAFLNVDGSPSLEVVAAACSVDLCDK